MTVYLAGASSNSSTNTKTSNILNNTSDTTKTIEGSADTMILKTRTPTTTTPSDTIPTTTATTPDFTNVPTRTSSLPVTSGGRVLAVTGLGNTLRSAVDNAYLGVKVVNFQGMHYRTDIAKR